MLLLQLLCSLSTCASCAACAAGTAGAAGAAALQVLAASALPKQDVAVPPASLTAARRRLQRQRLLRFCHCPLQAPASQQLYQAELLVLVLLL